MILGRFGGNVQPSLPALLLLASHDINASFQQLIERISTRLQENGIQLYLNYEEASEGRPQGIKFTVQFDQDPNYRMSSNADYVSSYNSDTGAYMDYLDTYPGPDFGHGENHWM